MAYQEADPHGAESFDYYLNSLFDSQAYAVFCERVYGRDLTQFNAFDETQLQILLSKLHQLKPERILDLGCGLGRITEFIARNTSSKIVGMDFTPGNIKAANARAVCIDNLKFAVGNLNSLSKFPGQFDLILAIDSLCFVTDLNVTFNSLREKLSPQGTIIAFHSYRNKDTSMLGPIDPTHSAVGRALTLTGFSYEVHDYTEAEQKIWERALASAHSLKIKFDEEQNTKICEDRIWEAKRTLEWLRDGRYCRSMFIAQ
ncbi:MAG: methyltransferase domain-containing protein [Bdellovibrionota bacterium]